MSEENLELKDNKKEEIKDEEIKNEEEKKNDINNEEELDEKKEEDNKEEKGNEENSKNKEKSENKEKNKNKKESKNEKNDEKSMESLLFIGMNDDESSENNSINHQTSDKDNSEEDNSKGDKEDKEDEDEEDEEEDNDDEDFYSDDDVDEEDDDKSYDSDDKKKKDPYCGYINSKTFNYCYFDSLNKGDYIYGIEQNKYYKVSRINNSNKGSDKYEIYLELIDNTKSKNKKEKLKMQKISGNILFKSMSIDLSKRGNKDSIEKEEKEKEEKEKEKEEIIKKESKNKGEKIEGKNIEEEKDKKEEKEIKEGKEEIKEQKEEQKKEQKEKEEKKKEEKDKKEEKKIKEKIKEQKEEQKDEEKEKEEEEKEEKNKKEEIKEIKEEKDEKDNNNNTDLIKDNSIKEENEEKNEDINKENKDKEKKNDKENKDDKDNNDKDNNDKDNKDNKDVKDNIDNKDSNKEKNEEKTEEKKEKSKENKVNKKSKEKKTKKKDKTSSKTIKISLKDHTKYTFYQKVKIFYINYLNNYQKFEMLIDMNCSINEIIIKFMKLYHVPTDRYLEKIPLLVFINNKKYSPSNKIKNKYFIPNKFDYRNDYIIILEKEQNNLYELDMGTRNNYLNLRGAKITHFVSSCYYNFQIESFVISKNVTSLECEIYEIKNNVYMELDPENEKVTKKKVRDFLDLNWKERSNFITTIKSGNIKKSKENYDAICFEINRNFVLTHGKMYIFLVTSPNKKVYAFNNRHISKDGLIIISKDDKSILNGFKLRKISDLIAY